MAKYWPKNTENVKFHILFNTSSFDNDKYWMLYQRKNKNMAKYWPENTENVKFHILLNTSSFDNDKYRYKMKS